MAEAWMPRYSSTITYTFIIFYIVNKDKFIIIFFFRFGHGAFLVCLEELYKKITGRDMIYTALIGKPSELTMHHADNMAQLHAKALGFHNAIKRIYFVGYIVALTSKNIC